MSNTFFDDRVDAVVELQNKRKNTAPGSDLEAIYDKAIDYVLSEDRTDTKAEYRVRAVTRNARHAHCRGKDRRTEGFRRLCTAENLTGAFTDRCPARTENRKAMGAAPSAEDTFLEGQSAVCAKAIAAARGISPKGPAFVRALMNGSTVTQAAEDSGMSRATGYRLVAHLRDALGVPVAMGGAA